MPERAFSWWRVVRVGVPWIAVLLLLLIPGDPEILPTDRPVLAETRRTGAAQVPGGTPAMRAAERRIPLASGGSVPTVEVLAPQAASEPRMAFCGLDVPVSIERQVFGLPAELPDGVRLRSNVRSLAALTRHADERVRAAGALFEAAVTETATRQQAEEAAGKCREAAASAPQTACDSEDREVEAATAAQRLASSASVDRLARMALSTRDGFVYGLAFNACEAGGRMARAPGCEHLSLEQWARLDPHNGAVWLWWLERARSRGDAAGVAEALHRLAHATTVRYDAFATAALVVDNLPPDLLQVERTVAELQAADLWMRWSLPPFSGVAKECSASAVRDANRAQTCRAISRVLRREDGAAIGAMIGARIVENLGAPAERVADLRADLMAATTAAGGLLFPAGEQAGMGCEQMKRLREWGTLARDKGELGASRELLRRAGMDPAKVKADYLARQASRRVPRAASQP